MIFVSLSSGFSRIMLLAVFVIVVVTSLMVFECYYNLAKAMYQNGGVGNESVGIDHQIKNRNESLESSDKTEGIFTTNDGSVFAVQTVFKGLNFPTSMAFLNHDDILVLEMTKGTVRRITNGTIQKEPLLDVNVATNLGMLGIAVTKNTRAPTYVFLYYTETKDKDHQDVTEGKEPLGNHLYRYEIAKNGSKLINPKLLLDLPATPGPFHHGGVIKIGPDNNLYIAVGDLDGDKSKASQTKSMNYRNGVDPDGRAGILRVTQDGKPVDNGILGNKYPLNLYFAYGIRNSFGLDFDPVTGNLWDTEKAGKMYKAYGNQTEPVKDRLH